MSCKLWNLESPGSTKLVDSFETDGFVQCVQFSPDAPSFYYGTSRNILGFADPRSSTSAMTIQNDAMVNTLHVFQSGYHVLTGDSLGALKTWDTRNKACIQTQLNELTQKPISHIATSGRGHGEEPRWLGVSSYDNIVRIWDRGISPQPDATRYRLGI
jgi:COMPASS component SWD3